MTGPDDLAIYVHWPFCLSKCPYCDFNSHVADAIDEERWRRALLADLASFAPVTGGRRVTSVFFGGGTPSLMAPDTVAAVLAAVRAHWPAGEGCEVTLEANPSTADRARFRALREAGVNRLSVGVQSFDDRVLAFLGRRHDAAEARACLAAAERWFPRRSLDLIYAWPGQTADDWRRDLAAAVAQAGGHVSAYQLTVERGTPFHRRGVRMAGDDVAADLYAVTEEVLAGAGLPAYEVSNHAALDEWCRHNVSVWQGTDYLGIGPGAHGRVGIAGRVHATRQETAPDRWLAAVETRGDGGAERRALTEEERREELLLLGLRLTEGVSRARFRSLTGLDVTEAVDRDGLDRLLAGAFVALDARCLRATPSGRLCLDAVLGTLLAAR